MPELAEVMSNLWRLLVRLPLGSTGLLLRGDLLTLCGDLSLRGELWRLLPMPEVLWPECWLPARIRNEIYPGLAKSLVWQGEGKNHIYEISIL